MTVAVVILGVTALVAVWGLSPSGYCTFCHRGHDKEHDCGW